MKHLFKVWDVIEERLRGQYIMLFLDYDGTLTPIAEFPHLARLSSAHKTSLKVLAHSRHVRLAVVSGRSLNELKELIGIPEIIYVGNHGLEQEGPDLMHVHPGAEHAKELMRKIADHLKQVLDTSVGILIENKIFTLSVHYRQVSDENAEKARVSLLDVIDPYLERSEIIMTSGKKVWEIRPAIEWNKAASVLWLCDRFLAKYPSSRVCPVYVGDDQTDESAFKAIKYHGIGIRVTERPEEATDADYFLSSSDEVLDLLGRLKMLEEEPKPRV